MGKNRVKPKYRRRVLRLPDLVIVLGEYRYGIAQSRHRVRFARWLDKLIADCSVLDVSEGTTHHYADIIRSSGVLESRFRPMTFGLPHSAVSTRFRS